MRNPGNRPIARIACSVSMLRCVPALLLLVSLTLASTASPDEGISIRGVPVVKLLQGGKARIVAEVEAVGGKINEVELFHRMANDKEFRKTAMRPLGEQKYDVVVDMKGRAIEYFVVATGEQGGSASFPSEEPSLNPAAIDADGSSTGVEIVPLSPEEGSGVLERMPLIAFSFLEDGNSVDVKTVRIKLDGRDVTNEANVTRYILTFVPSKPLSFGPHTISVTASDTSGVALPEFALAFQTGKTSVAGRLPSITGDTYIDLKSDDITGPGASVRQEPGQTNMFRVRASGKYSILRYSGNVFLTSDEKSNKQPKHKFKGELKLPHLDFYAGDVTPTYSELVLWGKRVRGTQTNLKLGPVGISYVEGETRRKIEGEGQLLTGVGGVDSVVVTTAGTFKQRLRGLRTSVSRGMTVFGVNFAKVQDRPTSIKFGTDPKENIVLGTDLGFYFLGKRIIMEGEGAVSFITLDTSRGALTKAEADTTFDVSLPFDPSEYEKYFVINSSTVPLDPRDLSSLAYGVRLRGNIKRNVFDILYRSVGSAYYSLGATSLQNDKAGMKARDQISFGGGLLTGGITYESFRDNLSKDKQATKWTKSVSFSLGLAPGKGSLTRHDKAIFPIGNVVRFSKPALVLLEDHLNSFTFAYRIYDRENDAPDTLGGVNDVTTSYSLGFDVTVAPFRKPTRLSVVVAPSRKDDKVNPASVLKTTSVSLNVQNDLTRGLTLRAGYSLDKQSFPNQNTLSVDFKSYMIGATRKVFRERIEVFALLRTLSAEGNSNVYNSMRTFVEGGANYRFSRGPLLGVEVGSVRFNDKAIPSNDYRETIFRVTLNQNF
ncbi:MAG: hypothetical protein QME66_01715 [Candidatus Eisenbacteria bacterium]|nr:hypothetical protein [Candidatus Eisenbacteria bacterium]